MKKIIPWLLLASLFAFGIALNAYGQDFGAPFTVTGDLDDSTDVPIKTASANFRHCVTGVSVSTLSGIGSDQNVRLLSNDTVLWQCGLDANAVIGCNQDFKVPLCAVTGEALEIDVSGNPTDNLVFYNVQGFTKQMDNITVKTTP